MGTTSSTSQQHQLRNALHQHAETIIKLQNVYQCFAAQGNGNGEEYLVKKFTELATAAPSSSPTTITSSQKDEFQIPEAAKDKVMSSNTFFEAFVGHYLPLGHEVLQRLFAVLGGSISISEGGAEKSTSPGRKSVASTTTAGGGRSSLYLPFPAFCRAYYLFIKSTTEEKYKVVFAMFDVHGNGLLGQKEFLMTSLLLIRGEALESSGQSVKTIQELESKGDMKHIARCLVEAAFATYDMDGDDKLSYEEWVPFARDDAAIQSFLLSLSSTIRATPTSSNASTAS